MPLEDREGLSELEAARIASVLQAELARARRSSASRLGLVASAAALGLAALLAAIPERSRPVPVRETRIEIVRTDQADAAPYRLVVQFYPARSHGEVAR